MKASTKARRPFRNEKDKMNKYDQVGGKFPEKVNLRPFYSEKPIIFAYEDYHIVYLSLIPYSSIQSPSQILSVLWPMFRSGIALARLLCMHEVVQKKADDELCAQISPLSVNQNGITHKDLVDHSEEADL